MTIAKSALGTWTRVIVALILCAAAGARASTVWTGPITNFNHAVNGLGDQIVPGVKITRGGDGGLYNADSEGGAVDGVSPKDTMWAEGSITNIANLKFTSCPLESGHRPPKFVNHTYVVHLVSEDIYFSLTLTAWGGAGGNGQTSFSYARSTPNAAPPPPTPTVSITSPANGAIFTAPASVEIDATASVSSGSVTNVEFFTNGISAGSVAAAPFTLTESDLVVGTYALKAVATAAGISATSAVVTITVTNSGTPPTVTVVITNPPDGAIFIAPATLEIEANASASIGNVTNVEFFTNGVSLGSVQNPPFSLTISNVAAGDYFLTAMASAGGVSAGSSVVIISVTNPPPPSLTVEITSPSNGATFMAPATVDLMASTTVSNATVTSVQYFTNGVLLGSAQTPPYDLTVSNFLTGNYSLTAVALAGGITATSLVVNISVTNAVSGPPPITVTSPGVSGGQFAFSFSTQAGTSYVIESSTNLMTWIPVATNLASSGASQFSDSFSETGDVYYRVSQATTP